MLSRPLHVLGWNVGSVIYSPVAVNSLPQFYQDPFSGQKVLDQIGRALQQQYERWQLRVQL